MITLYGSGQSRSFRALWALEESGLDYNYQQVQIGSPKEGGTQTSSFKQMNFQGKVPTLVDNKTVVNESGAIVNYIANLVPETALIPITNPALRAYYDEICFFVISELEQPLWTNGKHTFVLPKELRVSSVLETTHWEFAKSLKALGHYLNGHQYAVDDHFTMADILIAHTLNWAVAFKFEVPDNLLAYKDFMYARSACVKALDKNK